jgi:predicted small secreted protein
LLIAIGADRAGDFSMGIFRRCNTPPADINYRLRIKSSEVAMTFRFRLRDLSLALTTVALLGGGMLLSGCNTIAGAGQDVSNIGYTVSGGAYVVQQDTYPR